jgi:hypothetical protein
VTPDFRLDDGERAHPLWQRLKAHWTAQLADLRVRNDRATLTEPETAALRGRIACLRGILDLDKDRPIVGP